MECICSRIILRINAGPCETLPYTIMLRLCFHKIHTPGLKIIQIFLYLLVFKWNSQRRLRGSNGLALVSQIYTLTFRSTLSLCFSVFDCSWMLTRCLNINFNSTNFNSLILVLMLLLKGTLFFSALLSLNEVYFPKCSMFTWKINNKRTQLTIWGLEKSLDSCIYHRGGHPGRVR